MEVYNNLGKGFLEIVYKDAIEYELEKLNIIKVDSSKREYNIKFTPTGALLYKLILNQWFKKHEINITMDD